MNESAVLVVGIDYSADSTAALERAIDVAHRCDLPIVVVHAIPAEVELLDPSDIWRSGDDSTQREQARLADHVRGVNAIVSRTDILRLAARLAAQP